MPPSGCKMVQMESLRLAINQHMTSVVGEDILCVLEKQSALVRVFVLERLSAAAEWMCNLFQREIETLEALLDHQSKLLDMAFNVDTQLHTAGSSAAVKIIGPESTRSVSIKQESEDHLDTKFLHLPACKEDVSPEHEERSSSLVQEKPEPPHSKETKMELLHRPEEADGSTMTLLPVKCKEDDDDESRDTEPAGSSSTQHMETEDCGTSQPTRDEQSSDSDTEDSDEWEETRVNTVTSLQTQRLEGQAASVSDELSRDVDSPKETHSARSRSLKLCSCNVCGKSFNRTDNLKTHMRIHTGERPFGCTVCSKSFTLKQNLKTHMGIHRNEKQFRCAICFKGFTRNAQLKKHQREKHAGENPVGCTEPEPAASTSTPRMKTASDAEDRGTPQPTTDEQLLDLHVCESDTVDGEEQSASHTLQSPKTQNVEGQRLGCTVCGKSFNRTDNLKIHMRIHSGDKPFSCAVCGKSFTLNQNLKTHMRIHTNERPFSCTICDKGFAQKIKLKTHMSTHTGERPFCCTVCSKTFNRTENLKTHMMTHTGEKPFSCTLCGQSFRHRGTLTNHMRTHTGDKPFSCTVCGQCFSRTANLKIHEDSHKQENL